MRLAVFPSLVTAVAITACTSSGPTPPSLQPPAAEAIDTRVPVEAPVNARPATPALVTRLAGLLAQARAGDADFAPLVQRAEQSAASAGPRGSESWLAAQQDLSAASAARGPTARALSDIDALGADALQSQGGLAPADLAAIKRAAEEVAAIDRRQAARIASISARLG
jgi:hypothetical protein